MLIYCVDQEDKELAHVYRARCNCLMYVKRFNDASGKPELYILTVNGIDRIRSKTPIYFDGKDPYVSGQYFIPDFAKTAHSMFQLQLQDYRNVNENQYFEVLVPHRIKYISVAEVYTK